MPEGITPEGLLNNIMESISDGVSKHKSGSFFEEEKSSSVSAQFNRLFGRQKPVHHCLGGGKPADVLLWRNKKISASVLVGATLVWMLFEWLDYHLLTLICIALVLGLLVQFLWTHTSGMMSSNRSPSQVPRLVLPEEVFVNIATTIGAEVNRALISLQDLSCGGSVKQFLIVVGSLFAVSVIGSWCNFLTVLYIGFVAAHTLPVLYERYEDEVDNFAYNAFDQLQHQFRKLDSGVLSKIPKGGKLKGKKFE
nr:reticulon-like protein B8 [Ipomoea batatas]GME19093.1 reticulon-like protein B8 [Ipomoea batatas]